MQQFTVRSLVVIWVSFGGWFTKKAEAQVIDNQNIQRKDTLNKDTLNNKEPLRLITDFNLSSKKDTNVTSPIGLQRDTTFRPTVPPPVTSELRVGDLTHVTVCPGSAVLVFFNTVGTFDEKEYFQVYMADPAGKFVPVADSARQSPIRVVLPANRSGRLSMKVLSTRSKIESNATHLTLLPLPHARIEMNDGSAAAKIGPGQSATYRVMLTGAAPWSFTLSDGTTVANTLVNPYTAQVAPPQTDSYKVMAVSNACGSGTASGEVVVQVSQDTLPVIALKAVPKAGFRVCTGTPFQINFNATGKYSDGNGFVVQLSDSTGENFTNVSDLASESPIMSKTPFGIKAGNYKLRVVSTFPTISSDTVDVNVSSPAAAFLRRDTLDVPEGGSTHLTLDFEGGGPWFVLLSDGTYQNDIRVTPYTLKVTPYNPTAYTITSAGGFCGVGNFAGSAFVRVKIPPATITTGSMADKTICAGTEITVPFSSTGRFNNANRFVVQLTDTSGKWISLPTVGGASALRAKILPPFLTDTLTTQSIRVVSTDPYVEGTPATLKVMMPNAAQALVTGGGVTRPGGAARLKVTFKNGLPPWSFTLSDGTSISGTFINPYQITVNPRVTTEYKVVTVSNTCGTGITNQEGATVRVETN